MEKKGLSAVSVSRLQFNLSRTLGEATENQLPFYIQNRHIKTHLVVPIALVTENLMSAIEHLPQAKHQCCGACSCGTKPRTEG